MSSDPLPAIKLDDLLEFNEQLIRLKRAGMPIDLGSPLSDTTLDEQLSRITAHVALQIGRNRLLSEALADASHVPQRYAQALALWRSSDKHPAALEIVIRPAEAQTACRNDVDLTLIQPMVIFGLVYIGVVILVWRVAPIMEVMVQQSRGSAGPFLHALLFLRDTQSIWMIALPILAVLALSWWRWRSGKWHYTWVPGSQVANRSIELSAMIDGMASALAAGHAQPITANLRASHAGSLTLSPPTAASSSTPLLVWALGDAESDARDQTPDNESQVKLLRSLARAYRGRAHALATRWRRWLPIVIGALLGGAIVLPYGLMLFGPMVELLLEICQPRRIGS